MSALTGLVLLAVQAMLLGVCLGVGIVLGVRLLSATHKHAFADNRGRVAPDTYNLKLHLTAMVLGGVVGVVAALGVKMAAPGALRIPPDLTARHVSAFAWTYAVAPVLAGYAIGGLSVLLVCRALWLRSVRERYSQQAFVQKISSSAGLTFGAFALAAAGYSPDGVPIAASAVCAVAALTGGLIARLLGSQSGTADRPGRRFGSGQQE